MSANEENHPYEKFDESNFKTYEGTCHCGKVKFTASISPPIEEGEVMSCNCSICHINGYLNVYTPNRKLAFHPDQTAAMQELSEYQFGKGRLSHYFCKSCGSSILGRPVTSDLLGDVWCINVRSLKDIDLDTLRIKLGNGKNDW